MDYTNFLILEFDADADRRMAAICRVAMGLMALVVVLNLTGIFRISSILYPVLLASIAVMFLPTVLYDFLRVHSRITRYFVLTLTVLMSGVLYAFLSYHVIIMLVFPVTVSCLYCDRASVLFTTALSLPVMAAAHLLAFHFRVIPDEPLVTLRGVLFYGLLPRSIELVAISVICLSVTGKLQRLIAALLKKNNELYSDQEHLVRSLAELVETQSRETGQHVKRVAAFTEVLCRALGLPDEEVRKVSLASMLHDVGKLGVPREVLQKPGPLTPEEFDRVKKHVDCGYDLLQHSSGEIMHLSARIAQQHHERFDGTGYQLGLKGEQIDLYARCVAIADVFDALVNKRCYKDAWPPEKARAEILSQAGRQFDPALTVLFDQHFDEFLAVMDLYPDE